MKSFIGLGKFSKFYYYILFSTLAKLLLNLIFTTSFYIPNNEKIFINCSFLPESKIKDHVFIYYLYTYLGYIIYSLFFLIKNHRDNEKQISKNELFNIKLDTTLGKLKKFFLLDKWSKKFTIILNFIITKYYTFLLLFLDLF